MIVIILMLLFAVLPMASTPGLLSYRRSIKDFAFFTHCWKPGAVQEAPSGCQTQLALFLSFSKSGKVTARGGLGEGLLLEDELHSSPVISCKEYKVRLPFVSDGDTVSRSLALWGFRFICCWFRKRSSYLYTCSGRPPLHG